MKRLRFWLYWFRALFAWEWNAGDQLDSYRFFIRTPLFGYGYQHNYCSFTRDGHETSEWLGVFPRRPNEGGYLYRLNWRRCWTFTGTPVVKRY